MTERTTRGMVMALALLALAAWTGAEAAEIKVLSTVGMQPATSELFAQFERASGHKIAVTYGLAAVLKQSFADGRAAADVLVLTSPLVEDLAKQGKVAAGSKVDVARSGVGVGVKSGAPKPDISTPEALKSAVLAAKSVGFAKEGARGSRSPGRSSAWASPSRSGPSTRTRARRPARRWSRATSTSAPRRSPS